MRSPSFGASAKDKSAQQLPSTAFNKVLQEFICVVRVFILNQKPKCQFTVDRLSCLDEGNRRCNSRSIRLDWILEYAAKPWNRWRFWVQRVLGHDDLLRVIIADVGHL